MSGRQSTTVRRYFNLLEWLQARVLCGPFRAVPFRAMKVDRNIGPVPQSTFRATPQKSDMSIHVLFLRIVLQYYNTKIVI
jgi:hypothetical protein